MAQEIERKFLTKSDAWRSNARGRFYRQGYLSTVKERTVRIRTIKNQGYITVKGIAKGAVRAEYEYEIPVKDANEMLDTLCAQPIIEKTRYEIEHNGLIWLVDEFEGLNKGLILVEVELSDENQKIALPDWVGAEVTGDPDYFNSNLIGNPFLNWGKNNKMKRLALIRHAKSSWKCPNLDDIDRPLNSRGRRDAPMMGKRLAKDKVLPDLMISSPAKRAWKTAKIIAREVGCEKAKIVKNTAIYEAGVSALVQIIQKIDDKHNNVMIFGHNPGFNSLSHYLTSYEVDNIPTCGIFVIEFAVNSWQEVSQGKGEFISFDYPKKEQL